MLTTAEENNSEMKLRKVKDLCLQIVQLVHAAVSTSMVAAMDKLKELTQNFPTHASVVSTTRVERKLRSEALNWYNSGLMGLLPSNSLYINGRRFDLSGNTFNIFDVLKTCRSELALHQKIVAAGLPLEWQQAVLQLAASVSAAVTDNRKGENIIRIDVSKGGKNVVNFLNNLEKDEMYAMWPKSLRQLLYPSWSIQTIARNIYTLIGVVDLLSEDGANLFMQFNMLYQQQYPIRFGSVFSCSSVISVEHSQNEHFCRLFSHLKSQISSEVAMEFAGHIASNVLGLSQLGEAITVATVDSLYKSFLFERSLEVPRLVIVHDENDVVFQTRQYLEARGLSANSYSLNGIVFQSSTIAPSFMQVLGREQFLVTQLYREGKLKDKLKKSLFSTILAENPGGSFLRYHPVLDQKEPVAIDFNTPAGRQFLSTVSYLQSTSGAGSSMENTKPFANTVNMLVPAATSGAADVLTMMRWFSRKTDNPCRLSFHFYSPSGPYAAISNHVSIDTDGTTSARRIGNFQEELDVLLSLTSALKTVPSVEEANKVALAVRMHSFTKFM